MSATQHDADVLDQFTRQAEPFVQRHREGKDGVLDLMAECAAVKPDDTLLDVACGPGIVSCFFAKRVHQVTGLDFVPAMLDRARLYQAEQQVENVQWLQGSVTELPFAAGSFDCVVTRFSFHHFLNPQQALDEMTRAAKPGGTVLVCDVAPCKEAQDRFNEWEILRDPSHTRALTEAEFEEMGRTAGLTLRRAERYGLQMELENLLSGSFPKPGDADRIRALFDAEVQAATDSLGVAVRSEAGTVRITYPVVAMAWQKPA